MIVPSSRLLFWVAIAGIPAAVLVPALPAALFPTLFCATGFIALAVGDALMGRSRLSRIRVELPEIVRMAKGRVAEIAIRIRSDRAAVRRVRIGLLLPPELESDHADMTVELPRKGAHSRTAWPCLPHRRGSYFLRWAHLECPSPLGLWAVRGRVEAGTEVRVYPDLRGERKGLAALFLNRGALGLHVQRQVGKGREFEKLREYIPGDSSEDIHWKATAKRGHPVTKVFQIERTQEIYVVLDSSRLSARPATPTTRRRAAPQGGEGTDIIHPPECATTTLERYITAGLTLGLAAEQQGDLFGLVTFSDRVQHFIRAKNGKAHYALCRDAIYGLHPGLVTPDFEELATFLRLRLRRRALLVLLTELDDPVLAETFVRAAESLARQHLILVNMLQPAAARPLFTGPEVASVDDIYHRLGGHLLWHDLQQLTQILRHRGVQFSLVENERLSADLVTQYLGVKRRQLL